MSTDSKPPKPGVPPEPFFPASRATAPMGLEEDSESAWQRFEALRNGAEAKAEAPAEAKPPAAPGYEPTQPLEHVLKARAIESRRAVTLDEVMNLARRNNRACPLPAPWAALHDLLPARVIDGRTQSPPPPVDRKGWAATSAMQKRLRLRDQIEWADRAGVLQAAHDFLARLPEEHWHHFD